MGYCSLLKGLCPLEPEDGKASTCMRCSLATTYRCMKRESEKLEQLRDYKGKGDTGCYWCDNCEDCAWEDSRFCKEPWKGVKD
jgi:hypothetical protein